MASIGEIASDISTTVYTVFQITSWILFAASAFFLYKKKFKAALAAFILAIVLFKYPVPQSISKNDPSSQQNQLR